MLTLDIPTEPRWLDLPQGVRLLTRPVTTAVMQAAQSAAARRLEAAREAGPLDPDWERGLAFLYLVQGLARHAVLDWQGVGDTAGAPLALSPEAMDRLMEHDAIASAFWMRATAPVQAVVAEGNGCAPALRGIGAVGSHTAAVANALG
jgi:hypothetical protein